MLKFKCLVFLPALLEVPKLPILYLGLHVHGSLGLLAFDSPVLSTVTNETCSLDESELNCSWSRCRACELLWEKLPEIFKRGPALCCMYENTQPLTEQLGGSWSFKACSSKVFWEQCKPAVNYHCCHPTLQRCQRLGQCGEGLAQNAWVYGLIS